MSEDVLFLVCLWSVVMVLIFTAAAYATPVPPPIGSGGCGSRWDNPLPHVRTFVLGDSITYGLVPDLAAHNIAADGIVCRQWSEGVAVLPFLPRRSYVVIELGTNGPISWSDVRRMMFVLRFTPRVSFVTVKEDRWWQNEVNAQLWQAKRWWGKVSIIDWYTASYQHPEYFGPDGIHPNTAGDLVLASMIARSR